MWHTDKEVKPSGDERWVGIRTLSAQVFYIIRRWQDSVTFGKFSCSQVEKDGTKERGYHRVYV